jgi:hypothetical protein
MYCENTQKFDTPAEMIIHPQMIFDEDDTTPLFKIAKSYTALTPFACVVSDKSLKVPFSNTRNGEILKKWPHAGLARPWPRPQASGHWPGGPNLAQTILIYSNFF